VDSRIEKDIYIHAWYRLLPFMIYIKKQLVFVRKIAISNDDADQDNTFVKLLVFLFRRPQISFCFCRVISRRPGEVPNGLHQHSRWDRKIIHLNAERLLLWRWPVGLDFIYNVAMSEEVARALKIDKLAVVHMQWHS
jgi:hypothetical protein